MTDKTRRELVYEACEILGLRPGGQVPSTSDYNLVDGKIDAVLETLRGKGIVYVPNTDAIDPAVFLPVADFVAAACCRALGIPTMDTSEAKRTLYEIGQNGPHYTTQTASYF